MRIAIEGMDGSGKTTIAKILSEKLGYKYMNKPFKIIYEGLNLNEKQIKDLEWRLYELEDEALLTMFYGIGLLYGTRCSDENIIYDRHFVSNYYWHGNEETQKLHEVIIDLCGKPDLTILLKASVDERMKRINDRDKLDRDLTNSAMYDYGYDKMENYLRNNNFNYLIIDTEQFNQKEVIEKIIENIHKMNAKILVKKRKK